MTVQKELFQAPTAQRNGNKIVVIDGHALAFRSYYAIRELSNSQGRSVNAVFGFLRSLLRILKEEGEHDATVVTFDAPAKTFRHEQYEEYKAGRAATPDDLPEQIVTIKKLVDMLGLYQIEVAGLEADDLIGTIAKSCEANGYTVEIVTSDRDAYQLVSDHVCVRGLDKNDRLGPREIEEKYGVTVEQWTDYRALIGDSSDNIPGAKGIGPVAARNLLQRYGSLDYIFEHLDEIEPPGAAKKIRDSLEQVKFSRELSCIVTDAKIPIEPSKWAQREMQREGLRELLVELEFTSLLRELGLTETPSYREVPWNAGDTRSAAGAVGFVLAGDSPMQAQLTELAVARERTVAKAPDEESALAFLAGSQSIDACDAKALAVWARSRGERIEPGDDPLLMAYVLDPNVAQPDTAAQRYGAGDWTDAAPARAAVTAELLRTLPEKFDGPRRRVYEEIEKPLQRVLVDVESRGVVLDKELLAEQSVRLAEQLTGIEARVRSIAQDDSLNINSRDQVATLLYEKLGLQSGRKTSTGKQSTAVGVLEGLRDKHEAVGLILDYRELSKLKGTYLDPLPKLVNPGSGRLHTTYQQTVAVTGRLSSINPNLQNIPIRTETGREIRRAFRAAPGHVLLAADYSQIELRVLAHIAGEQVLIDSFSKGEDIHRRTAAQVHGCAPEEVTPDMRRVAKVINFGVLYGMGAHRLTRELGIEYAQADLFIKTYFERYPKVRAYIDGTLEFCRANGYVETLLGRRRLIPDIRAANRNAREYAERTAYNMPIQGTAADIMKLAMLQLAPRLEPLGAGMILQVHDELVVEAPVEVADEASQILCETMENAYRMDVPLLVEVGVGENWLEAK
ncbi:MAG TPA: DNA polymerase I [Trueperaceae bacterium]